MIDRFDAIIIGAGQAGPPLAVRLAKAGMRIALAESAQFGGTCVNNGCIPTKALVASAYAAQLARRVAEYGVVAGEVEVDAKRIKARKDAIVAHSRDGVERQLKELDNCTIYRGHARFVETHTLDVSGARLQADKIFINVGARAAIPSMPGLDKVPYLTNAGMMELEVIPRHLIIVGGSYIGLEFGQMYRRFGAEVTIVEMGPRLIGREDEDVSQAVKEILEREGMHIRLDAECLSVERTEEGIAINAECAGPDKRIAGSHLLIAVGRKPNTDDLGLETAGIATDDKGHITVDEELRTNVPGVWALGECNGRGAFTHTSYNDYEIVAANLLDGEHRKLSDRILTYALFTDPPLGRAGMTEAEVKRSGRRALIAMRPMSKVSRAVEKGETQGFMKILVDKKSKRILGAAILGTGGDEVVHSILDIMYAKKPYTVIQRAVHIHPTVSELVPTMLGELKPFKN